MDALPPLPSMRSGQRWGPASSAGEKGVQVGRVQHLGSVPLQDGSQEGQQGRDTAPKAGPLHFRNQAQRLCSRPAQPPVLPRQPLGAVRRKAAELLGSGVLHTDPEVSIAFCP